MDGNAYGAKHRGKGDGRKEGPPTVLWGAPVQGPPGRTEDMEGMGTEPDRRPGMANRPADMPAGADPFSEGISAEITSQSQLSFTSLSETDREAVVNHLLFHKAILDDDEDGERLNKYMRLVEDMGRGFFVTVNDRHLQTGFSLHLIAKLGAIRGFAHSSGGDNMQTGQIQIHCQVLEPS